METSMLELYSNGWEIHERDARPEYITTYRIVPEKPFVYSIVKTVKYTTTDTYKKNKSFFRKEYKVFSLDCSLDLYLCKSCEDNAEWVGRGLSSSYFSRTKLTFDSVEDAEEYLSNHLRYEKDAKEFMSQKPIEVKV